MDERRRGMILGPAPASKPPMTSLPPTAAESRAEPDVAGLYRALAPVTRFEVIDGRISKLSEGNARALVAYSVEVTASLQDDGRTLKVFLTDRDMGEPPPEVASGIPRDQVSGPCQYGRHGECAGKAMPYRTAALAMLDADPCECPMHTDPGALCWGDIRRVEVRP